MAHSFTLAFAQTLADVLGTIGSGQIVKPAPPRLTYVKFCPCFVTGYLSPTHVGRLTLSSAVGAVLEMLVWMYLSLLVMRFTYISRRWPMESGVREASLQLGIALSVCTVLLVVSLTRLTLKKYSPYESEHPADHTRP
jgi:hypothetical protein